MTNWEPLSAADVLTPAEFASIYKVSEDSVKLAAKRGQLPAVQIGKQRRIFSAASRVVPGLEPATPETEEAH
jgi:Helix-turn-helix domain